VSRVILLGFQLNLLRLFREEESYFFVRLFLLVGSLCATSSYLSIVALSYLTVDPFSTYFDLRVCASYFLWSVSSLLLGFDFSSG
jgi:hypothetical protein